VETNSRWGWTWGRSQDRNIWDKWTGSLPINKRKCSFDLGDGHSIRERGIREKYLGQLAKCDEMYLEVVKKVSKGEISGWWHRWQKVQWYCHHLRLRGTSPCVLMAVTGTWVRCDQSVWGNGVLTLF
jgi:hypothetical protein